jgi:uncharacterized protein YecT (DUF1311 family)
VTAVFRRALAAIGIIAIGGCVRRATAYTRTNIAECSDTRTTADGQQCRAKALITLDGAIRIFEDSVYRRLDSVVVNPLRRVDSLWAEYRNLECMAAAGTEHPGSVVPILELQCKIDRTSERLRYLQATYRPWLKP